MNILHRKNEGKWWLPLWNCSVSRIVTICDGSGSVTLRHTAAPLPGIEGLRIILVLLERHKKSQAEIDGFNSLDQLQRTLSTLCKQIGIIVDGWDRLQIYLCDSKLRSYDLNFKLTHALQQYDVEKPNNRGISSLEEVKNMPTSPSLTLENEKEEETVKPGNWYVSSSNCRIECGYNISFAVSLWYHTLWILTVKINRREINSGRCALYPSIIGVQHGLAWSIPMFMEPGSM